MCEGMPVLMKTSDSTLRRPRISGAETSVAALHQALALFPFEPGCISGAPQIVELGSMSIGRFDCSPALIRRESPGAAAQRDKAGILIFQLSGRSRIDQLGRSAQLEPGDACLCDMAAAFDLKIVDGGEILGVRVPFRVLKDHLPSPDWFCSRAMTREAGMNAPIVAMLQSLMDGSAAALSEAHQQRVGRHLLDLVATSYAIAFDATAADSSIIVGRQASVKLFIEQNLRDPELTPCTIAARLKFSPRYLRLIFASGDATVSAYILRRRLEECARQIGDPRWRGHSMTEIAFAWGFNSAPHFSRSFRDRFGVSPRAYRRTTLEGVAAGCVDRVAA